MLARLRLLPVHQLLRVPSLPRKIFLLVKFLLVKSTLTSLYVPYTSFRIWYTSFRHILIQGRLEYGLLCRRIAEDGEVKGVFGLTPSDQEQGGRRKTRSEVRREHPTSRQAPKRRVGENPRRARRERPLSLGSELQVLSSEAGGAGGAVEAARAREREVSTCFEDDACEAQAYEVPSSIS